MSDAFTSEEIKELRTLLEIEKIKKTKLLYSQLMDSRDIDGLAEIFAEDAICEFGPDYGVWTGKAEIHANYKKVFGSHRDNSDALRYGGFHVTTNQWVELTGSDTAVSRTYLIDTVHEADPRTNPIIWLGLYDEDYVKVNGEWKIKRSTLQYLWPRRMITDSKDGPWPGPFPPVES
jgi:hypothetical protein